jgi:hypothetical protein
VASLSAWQILSSINNMMASQMSEAIEIGASIFGKAADVGAAQVGRHLGYCGVRGSKMFL